MKDKDIIKDKAIMAPGWKTISNKTLQGTYKSRDNNYISALIKKIKVEVIDCKDQQNKI